MALFSRAAVAAAVLVGGLTRHAQAELATPFRVESLPGATCPSGEPFATQLLRRTDRIREAEGDESAVVFRVEVARADSHTTGRLTVRELDGSELTRDVAGADCEEVVSAMVLIAAILVDPNASLEPLPAPRTEPPKPPSPPRPPSAEARGVPGPVIPAGRTPPAGALVRPRSGGEGDGPGLPESPDADSPPGPRRRAEPGGSFGGLTVGAGVRLALEGAPMSKLVAGIAVSGIASLERGSILSPSLEGSFVRTQTVAVQTPSGVGEFRFASVRLLACPLRFPAASAVALRPCALGELGELEGIGKVTQNAEVVSARWVALGGAVRASVRLVGPLALVGEGALVVPLIRHEFFFDPQGPESTALAVSAVGTSTRLGVVAEFE